MEKVDSISELLMINRRADYHFNIFIALLLEQIVTQRIGLLKKSDTHYVLMHQDKNAADTDQYSDIVQNVLFRKSRKIQFSHAPIVQEASQLLERALDEQMLTQGYQWPLAYYIRLTLWCLGAIFVLAAGWLFLNLLYISTTLVVLGAFSWLVSFCIPRLTQKGRSIKHYAHHLLQSVKQATHLDAASWLRLLPLAWYQGVLHDWDKKLLASKGITIKSVKNTLGTVESPVTLCEELLAFSTYCHKVLSDTGGAMQGVANQYDVTIGV